MTFMVRKMGRRDLKFYREQEQEVMRSLGLEPTKNSGSGWIEKEDGQNDYLICQLKTTDAQSITINQKDIRVLEKNAAVSHKTPIFTIHFNNTGETWIMAKPTDFGQVSDVIRDVVATEKVIPDIVKGVNMFAETQTIAERPTVASSSKAREKFHKEQELAREKAEQAYKERLRAARRR